MAILTVTEMTMYWPMLYSFISCCRPTLFVASEEQTVN